MAVAQKTDARLQLAFENGLDEKGNLIVKNKSFNNVKIDATPDQLYAITMALVPLQQLQLHMIKRNGTELISAQ